MTPECHGSNHAGHSRKFPDLPGCKAVGAVKAHDDIPDKENGRYHQRTQRHIPRHGHDQDKAGQTDRRQPPVDGENDPRRGSDALAALKSQLKGKIMPKNHTKTRIEHIDIDKLRLILKKQTYQKAWDCRF